MAEAKTTAAAQKAAPKAAAAPKKSTTAKPAAAKPAAAKPAAKKAAAPKKAVGKPGSLSPEERYKWVETRAYFIAESDSFRGDPQSYWAQAEIQIAAVLK